MKTFKEYVGNLNESKKKFKIYGKIEGFESIWNDVEDDYVTQDIEDYDAIQALTEKVEEVIGDYYYLYQSYKDTKIDGDKIEMDFAVEKEEEGDVKDEIKDFIKDLKQFNWEETSIGITDTVQVSSIKVKSSL